MKQFLKQLLPEKLLRLYRNLRYNKPSLSGWHGDYSSWKEASAKTIGYNESLILKQVDEGLSMVLKGQAAFERDSVAFKELIYSESLLNVFKSVAEQNNNVLSILDFGGSLGSIYFQYRTLLTQYKINWSVVEQSNFVDLGKEKYSNSQLSFFHTIAEAQASQRHDVLLLSSVLAYLDKPEEFLKNVLPFRFRYIVFYRTAFVNRNNHLLTVQYVPQSIYKASYPAWFFNEEKLTSILSKDYYIEQEFPGDIETEIMVGENKCYWKCLVFKLKQ